MKKGRTRRRAAARAPEAPSEAYRSVWMALTPAERLRRSWRLRTRLRDLQAVHDEKSLPKL